MSSVLGLDCYTGLNSGTIASPTWSEIGLVKDETVNLSKALADVTTRQANGWRLQRGTLKEASIDLQLLYDPSDDDFDEFRDAFFNNTQLLLGFFDGDIEEDGTYYGLHAAFNVTAFSQPRNLEDAVVVDITLVPDLEAVTNTAPAWVTITVS